MKGETELIVGSWLRDVIHLDPRLSTLDALELLVP